MRILSAMLVLALVVPVSANMVLNPSFEDMTDNSYDNWTRLEGSLDGTGIGETPHTGSKSWHGAWNWGGSAQTTTYGQEVALGEGTYDAGMWSKGAAFGGIYGNDTHWFVLAVDFLDASDAVVASYSQQSAEPDDTYQETVLTGMTAPAGTTKAMVKFSYVTTQGAHAWKVWNVDDISLTPEPASLLLLLAGLPLMRRRRA